MKKLFKYAFLSAMALFGAVSFSSCSSNDEIVDNPDYNPETNTVKTQFAISLQDNIASTRMGAAAVQQSGTVAGFLGMKNIKLLPFATTSLVATGTAPTPVLGKTAISLDDIPATTSGDATESNKVYSDVAVPVTTSCFVLYGNAGQSGGFENGNLTVAGLETSTVNDLTGISFTPVPICPSASTKSEYRKCKNILALLNRVAGSSVESGGVTETWGTGDNQTTVAALVSLYTAFTSVKLGSSQYVKELLERLYESLEPIAGATTDVPGKALALKIRENILGAHAYTDGGTNYNCSANTYESSTLTLSADYTGYPTDLNLPNGAARIAFAEGKFVDATNSASSLAGIANAGDLSLYAYPANLQYFVNSDILTSTTNVLNGSMASFETAQGLYGTTPTKVVSERTRSILLNKQIQYGVGRLDVSVTAMSGTKYFDYFGTEVAIPDGGYTLTGILIGDQKPVGWNFAQTSGTAYTIYDKLIAGGLEIKTSKTAATAPNYTLVLETLDYVDANTTNAINVALEFTNNGADFYGKDGMLIPAGATFYLVGTLTPNPNDTHFGDTSTDPTKTKKVFAQDFVTTATFTIKTGAKTTDPETWDETPAGLGLAEIGLPDLRLPQMELGLSVDLQWKPGLTFNVDI